MNMKKVWNKQQKPSSSLHENIRKARFVNVEKEGTFKYKLKQEINRYRKMSRLDVKRFLMSLIHKPSLWAQRIYWDQVKSELFNWGIEAFIEGLLFNYVTFVLLGADFNIATIFAYGIIIKQGLSVYWRLRNGTSPKIPTKDK